VVIFLLIETNYCDVTLLTTRLSGLTWQALLLPWLSFVSTYSAYYSTVCLFTRQSGQQVKL